MPMVSEQSSAPRIYLNLLKDGATSSRLVPQGRDRSQIGYRSKSLTKEEELGIAKYSSSAHTASLIGFYEEAGFQYQKRASRAFTVNDRDYWETAYTPATFKQKVVAKIPGSSVVTTDIVGSWALASFDGSVIFPVVSSSTMQNMAGKWMRQSVPNLDHGNLVRFAGEQRDAPALFRASNYRPRNPKEAAGAYLNYIFGVKPTIDDVLRMSEQVLLFDKKLRQAISMEKVSAKTRKGSVLFEKSFFNPQVNRFTQCAGSSSLNLGFATVLTDFVAPFSSSGNSAGCWIPQYSTHYQAKQTLTQFATWEYFVPQPAKIETRLDKYKELAQQLIGEGASAGTVWNLTPWTWLSDWFVDVGGMLHYQQAINDNRIAATSNGYSFRETCDVTVKLHKCVYDTTGIVGPWSEISNSHSEATSTLSYVHHVRRGGNPYSIGPAWTSLSLQQWAIIGALGMSWSSGTQIKR